MIFIQTLNGAVVDHFTGFIAPGSVHDLTHFALRDVPSDDSVHKTCGVRPGDFVFEERRDIDQASRVANGIVLMIVSHLVCADGEISRPVAPFMALAEFGGSGVKRSGLGQSRFR